MKVKKPTKDQKKIEKLKDEVFHYKSAEYQHRESIERLSHEITLVRSSLTHERLNNVHLLSQVEFFKELLRNLTTKEPK